MNFEEDSTAEMFAFRHFSNDVDVIFPDGVGGTRIDGTGVNSAIRFSPFTACRMWILGSYPINDPILILQ